MHSDKVAYYILDLLQQVPSVYVPGLGRFDAIFHPAVIDLQQSTVKPPHVQPGFNADDKDTGELLPAYMHYVSGISKDDANSLINEFASNVNSHIENGESVTIEKFGTFANAPTGNLHFTPDWDAFNLSFSGLAVLDLKSAPATTQTETRTLPPVEEYTPPVIDKPIFKEEPVVENVVETSWVTDRENAAPETTVQHVAPVQPVISDSTSRLWWTILLTALGLITVLCAYLAWDILSNREKINQYTAITNEELSDQSPDIVFIDTLEVTEEEIPLQDTPVVEEPVEEPPPAEPAGNCRIVVGAFSDPKNVERMESRLSDMGYQYESFKNGSLTKVAIRTGCDKAELQKTLTEARTSINPEAWVY